MRKKADGTAQEEYSMNTESEKELKKEEGSGQQGPETSKYTIPEFCSFSKKIFDAGQDVVRAALMKGKKSEYTISEAKELVKAYAERQVK